jgi:hypothetical protein
MIKSNELMERFGDVEFLNELWQRAAGELPQRLNELRPYMTLEAMTSQEDLAKRLHKIRGLVSNFLTEGKAIACLVKCETLVGEERNEELPPLWIKFESILDEEINRLNRWIAEQG